MNEMLSSLIVFFVGITIHEFGHYIEMKRFNRKPYFKFEKGVILVKDKLDQYTFTPRKNASVALVGIYLALPIFYLHSYTMFLVYIIMCMFDILIIYRFFFLDKIDRDKTYKQLLKKEYNEVFK